MHINNIKNVVGVYDTKGCKKVDNPITKSAQEKTNKLKPDRQFVNAQTVLPHYTVPKINLSFSGDVSDDAEVINEKLEKTYGIKSDIQNIKILKNVLACVEDFCIKNDNNALFKGLAISEDAMDDKDNMYSCHADYYTKKFEIIFNSDYDWDNLAELTKESYEDGNIGSDNLKYNIYRPLALFLNFDYNPYAYVKNNKIEPTCDTKINMMRICYPGTFTDFNAHYIASKMCNVEMPKVLDDYFEERVGNLDLNLKIDNPKKPKTVNKDYKKFDSIKDAQDYLEDKYGIKADFDNILYANLCVSAVETLVTLFNDKDIFKGLEIKTDADKFDDNFVFGENSWDKSTGEDIIYINPAVNWKNADKIAKKDFESGLHSSSNLDNLFIHELCHYIDFKSNPRAFGTQELEFQYKQKYFNKYGLRVTSKVSRYATKSPAEFCAEYIVGRLAGNTYSKATNDEFEEDWHGPKINWDNLK